MELIIQSEGTNLSFQEGMIVLETDNQKEEISILQVESVHIQANARISSALIQQCIENQIPVYIEDQLQINAMIWSPQFGSIATIRQKQTLFSLSALKWPLIKRLMIRKLTNRFDWLRKTTRRKKSIHQQIPRQNIWETESNNIPDNAEAIRGWEGSWSKKYFDLYKQLLPEKYRFTKRTYRKTDHLTEMMLNYAYGILYKEIQKAVIIAGLDPYMPFLHRIQYAKPSLTFDLIEPYRVWAEKTVLQTIKHEQFRKENPTPQPLRQIPPNIKKLLITQMAEFLHQQKILYNNLIRTPRTHIRLDANRLATYLLNIPMDKLIRNIQQNP